MKKIIAITLMLGMIYSTTGCTSAQKEYSDAAEDAASMVEASTAQIDSETKTDSLIGAETEPPADATKTPDTQFVLEYPDDMQALGFTEPIVMNEMPKKVVSLSTAPVLALHELGANLVGIPISTVIVWPEELTANAESISFSVMSDGDFDFESVLALEPDLVFLASAAKDTAGAALESLGITVYYVYAGHTVPYTSIKMQTEALINAFDMTEESIAAGEAIMARFDALEEKLTETRQLYAGNSVLVLQSNSYQSHYAQTKEGTLGSLLDMIGFTNVYENETSSLAQIDLEQALSYNPDYIVAVGSGSAEYQQELMNKAFESNPEYWNCMTAVKNGNVICLDVKYIASTGINVIDNITSLIADIASCMGE